MESIIKYKLLKSGMVDPYSGYMYEIGKNYFYSHNQEVESLCDDILSIIESQEFNDDYRIYEVLFVESETQNKSSIIVLKEVDLIEIIKIYLNNLGNQKVQEKLKSYIYTSPHITSKEIQYIYENHKMVFKDYLEFAKNDKTPSSILLDICKKTKNIDILLKIYQNKNSFDWGIRLICESKIKNKFNSLFHGFGTNSYTEEELSQALVAQKLLILDNKKIEKIQKKVVAKSYGEADRVNERIMQILKASGTLRPEVKSGEEEVFSLEFDPTFKRLIKDQNLTKETLMFIIENYNFDFFFADLLENPNITKEMVNKILEKEKWKISYRYSTIERIFASRALDLDMLNKLENLGKADECLNVNNASCVFESSNNNPYLFRYLLGKKIYPKDKIKPLMCGILSSEYFNSEFFEEPNIMYHSYINLWLNLITGKDGYISTKIKYGMVFKLDDVLSYLIRQKDTPIEYLYALIKNPKVSDLILSDVLEILKNKFVEGEINNEEIILSIIEAEKKIVERIVQNQSLDSELPPLEFKKEYYKVLSKYLGSNKPQVNLLILKEMYKEGCISQKVIDGFYCSKCVEKCSRTLKLCQSVSNVIK